MKSLNKIELIKDGLNLMDIFGEFKNICNYKYYDMPKDERGFIFKCFGIFEKDDGTFMLRVRIPAGRVTNEQAKIIGDISKKYCKNRVDITTRQQIELRYIKLIDLPIIIETLDKIDITTFQTGIDNFRNIVTSPFDGFDGFIECKPIIDRLQSIFLKKEEWIGKLPRKFNSAIIGTTYNDCNIFGHDIAFVIAKKDNKIGFNLYLGGKVGIQAKNSNIFCEIDEVEEIFYSVISLFKELGFRDNRNKNRLHFLIDSIGIDKFREEIEKFCNKSFLTSGENLIYNEIQNDDIELKDYRAIHFPFGTITGDELIDIATLNGDIRLTVEQSFFVITKDRDIVKSSKIYKKFDIYRNSYFYHQIACAGSEFCQFGVIPKSSAIDLSNYLQNNIPLDRDRVIRLYWSACPKGCGIHGVGDIGFEGCKIKDSTGKIINGVHIYIGGKLKNPLEGRLLYKSVSIDEAKILVGDIIKVYIDNSYDGESFEVFESRWRF